MRSKFDRQIRSITINFYPLKFTKNQTCDFDSSDFAKTKGFLFKPKIHISTKKNNKKTLSY